MLTKPRLKLLTQLAIPNLGGVISVNIMFLVDTAMVGVLGDAALAAVGIGGYLFALATGIMIGIGTGVQALTARRKGENDQARLGNPYRAGMQLAFMLGVPLTVLAALLTPVVFDLLTDDPLVRGPGIQYAMIRLLGVIPLGINGAHRGYWNGFGKPAIYGYTMIVIQALNIFFNYVFIYGNFGAPRMEEFGAGLASTLGILGGSLIYLAHMAVKNRTMITRLSTIEEPDLRRRVLKQAVPIGIQEMFMNVLMLLFLGLVGVFGTMAQGVSQVLLRILLAMTLPAVGLGFAASGLIGQAMGRKDSDDAEAWGWDCIRLGSAAALIFTLPMLLFPAATLSVFIRDPELIAYGVGATRLVGVMCNFSVIFMILTLCLQGAGDPKRALKINLTTHLLIAVPGGILAGPILKLGITPVWAAAALNMVVLALAMMWTWRKGAWKHASV